MRRAPLAAVPLLVFLLVGPTALADPGEDAVAQACERLATARFGSVLAPVQLHAAADLLTDSPTKDAKRIARDINTAASSSTPRRTKLSALLRARKWCARQPTATTVPTTTAPVVVAQHFAGTGDGRVAVSGATNTAAMVRIDAGGSQPFRVQSYDASGNPLATVVDTTAPYSGTRAMNLEAGPTVARLDVTARGTWSIDIVPLSEAPHVAVPGRYDGSGDGVLVVSGSPTSARVVARGVGPFVVDGYGFIEAPLVDATGPYSGTIVMPAEASLVLEVTAGGTWSVDLS